MKTYTFNLNNEIPMTKVLLHYTRTGKSVLLQDTLTTANQVTVKIDTDKKFIQIYAPLKGRQ